MKKIFILLSILFVGKIVAQTTIFSENFNSGSSIGSITQFTNNAGEWIIDDGTNSPTPPPCNVVGSSAGNMLFGTDASSAGTFEEVGTVLINTSTFSNVRITWNSLNASASSPAVTFQINNTTSAATWTTIAYTNNSTSNTWAAVPTVTLPNNAITTSLYLRWTYTSTGSSGLDYVAIDDIRLIGDGTPVFYWNGIGDLDALTSWGVNPNGSGTNPFDFTTPGQTFNIMNAATATLTNAWAVSGVGTNVNIGDGSVLNQCHLTLPTGTAVLTLNSSAKLNVNNNSTLTIANTSFPAINSVNVFTASTVEWSQTASATIWNATYGNLFLNGGGNKLQPSNNVTVLGHFDLASGTNYVMVASATRVTRLSGLITCSGSITTNFSNLTIDGASSNNIGTINFTGTNPLNNLTLNRLTKTMTLGSPLHVLGTVTPSAGTIASAGNLTIRSTSGSKGRIGIVTGAITGNVVVQTFAAGGATDWANLGPSGVSGLTVASWEGQIPMSCFSCPNDENSAGGYFVSIQGWDETQPASAPTAYIEMSYSDPLAVGKGYWVYLGLTQGTTTDMTWDVTGPAVQGNQSINLTNSGVSNGDGYNLISNPYACPISWTALRNANGNVDNAIYVYNADLGITTSFVNGVSSNPGSGASNIIPMGQAFYVKASAATNLTAQESNKLTSGSHNQLLKTANTGIGDVVRLKVVGGGFSDETAIRFHQSATTSFDKEWDAYKLFTSPGYVGFPGLYSQRTTISTQSGNDDYSVNSLPYAQSQNAVIPVLVKVYASGQHTISASDLQNLPANACVTLFDKLTNTTHNLKTGDYVCTINDTTSTARFELTVCADLTASIANNNNLVKDESIFINTDANGAYVKLDFDKNTKTKISVTNILGQKVMETKSLTAQKETVYIPLEAKNQLLFVTVETSTNRVTKKIIR